MAKLKIVFWRDIPGQVVIRQGRRSTRIRLPGRFMKAIERAAYRLRKKQQDALFEPWHDVTQPYSGDIRLEAKQLVQQLEERVLPVGARDRIRPGTIVGKIAGATGLPGSVVGKINVQDRVTFVQVPAAHAHMIMDKLRGSRIAGRVVQPRLAHPEGDPGPRRHGLGLDVDAHLLGRVELDRVHQR